MRLHLIHGILFLSFIIQSYQLSCLDQQGEAVPWFFMIKYPNKTDVQTGENHRYGYFDSSMSGKGQNNFDLRTNYVDIPGEALYETLNQANTNGKYQIIAWNDEIPPVDENTLGSSNGYSYEYSETAHSKGIIVYDQNEGNGIYIPHSTPKYPAIESNGVINITVAWGQRVYGQNYLCMSLDKENLEKVASGLLLTGVIVYYSSFTDTSAPNMYQLSQNVSASSSASDHATIPFNLGSLPIVGFFKNPYFETGFIFEDVMVPYLQDSLVVESWGRPYQDPSCDLAGGYETDNVVSIKLCNDEEGSWENKDDHSKWAITKNKNYVCSGDMNRMTSQRYRGGSYFCFEDANMWSLLNGIIVSVSDCSSSKKAFLTSTY